MAKLLLTRLAKHKKTLVNMQGLCEKAQRQKEKI